LSKLEVKLNHAVILLAVKQNIFTTLLVPPMIIYTTPADKNIDNIKSYVL
jgi:hypothetical protein